jgi:hypothetical protein
MFSGDEVMDLERDARTTLMSVPMGELDEDRMIRAFRGRRPAHDLPDKQAAVDAVIKFRDGDRNTGLVWARGFMSVFVADIRRSLCSKHGGSGASRLTAATAKGAATAIASWLMAAFSVTNPFAIALAAFVTILMSSAAMSSFCVMTDQEVLRHLQVSAAQ